jgi:hypothetical protein
MPKQIARSFDPATVEKIKKSAQIALVGFLIAIIPMLQTDILTALADKPYLVAAITAFGGWVYNVLRQWLAGQEQG